MCVCTRCTFSTEGPGGYSRATRPQQRLAGQPIHNPLPWPFAPRLTGNPASGTHTTGTLHHPLPCSGPIDTARLLSSDQSFRGAVLPEENPIQRSLSGLCVCAYIHSHNVCLHRCVHVFMNENASKSMFFLTEGLMPQISTIV